MLAAGSRDGCVMALMIRLLVITACVWSLAASPASLSRQLAAAPPGKPDWCGAGLVMSQARGRSD